MRFVHAAQKPVQLRDGVPTARPQPPKMHNVKKVAMTEEKRAQKRREDEERAAKYSALSSAAMALRAERRYDEESLAATAKVLGINCEMTTLWNFRRETLRALLPEGGADARRAACEREFKLTQECLGINPKSYPVWHHREWVMQWGECTWQHAVDLKLTAKLLTLDERNFHCWTYRRFVAKVAGVPAEAELKFTSDKVNSNFSNYSAWHYRSKLLPRIHPAGAETLEPTLNEELQLLRSAFYISPEDQSAWFYHRWLLAQLAKARGAAAGAAAGAEEGGAGGADGGAAGASAGGAASVFAGVDAAVLEGELAAVRELLELEPGCKWPLLASALLAQALGRPAEARLSLEECKSVDPPRTRYYDHLLAQLSPSDAPEGGAGANGNE